MYKVMIKLISNNKLPTLWGFLATASFILKDNPELLSFLDPELSKRILGWSTLICAFLTGRYVIYKGNEKQKEEIKEKNENS